MRRNVKRSLASLLVLVMCLGMLPINAFAALGDTTQPEKLGGILYYDANGSVVSGATSLSGDPVVSVKKELAPAASGLENEFDITLTVETEESVVMAAPDSAVVLLLDGSNTMFDDTVKVTSGTGTKTVTRMQAAVESMVSFVNQYAGSAGTTTAKRYLSVVLFDNNAFTYIPWIDVADPDDKQSVIDKLNVLPGSSYADNKTAGGLASVWKHGNEYHLGGTNIEAGLMLTKNILAAGKSDILKDVEFVNTIFLSDGEPTVHVDDSTDTPIQEMGGNTDRKKAAQKNDMTESRNSRSSTEYIYGCIHGDNSNSSTTSTANKTKKVAYQDYKDVVSEAEGVRANCDALWTISMGDSNWTQYSLISNNGPKVNIGTLLNNISGSSDKVIDATSTNGVQNAFTTILQDLQAGGLSFGANADSGKVTDTLSDNVEFLGFFNKNGNFTYGRDSLTGTFDTNGEDTASVSGSTFTWSLGSSGYTKSNGITTYSVKYRVRLMNEASSFNEETEYFDSAKTLNGAEVKSATLKYQMSLGNLNVGTQKEVPFSQTSVEGYLGEFSFVKKDSVSERPLNGAVFTLAHDTANCACRTGSANVERVSIEPQVVTSGENGTAGQVVFQGIPSGHKYTLTETTAPDNYTGSVNSTVEVSYDSLTVDSAAAPAVIYNDPLAGKIEGQKIWVGDEGVAAKLRPASITINLLANGTEIKDTVVTAATNWAYSFTDLDILDAQGEPIVYTITEDPVDNYSTQVNGYNVTNTYTPGTKDVVGSKTWNHGNNPESLRPESITIRLLAGGVEVRELEVTAEDNWAWSFTGLAKYDASGAEIVYTITEDPVENYTSQVSGYNVTNTYVPVTTDVSGSKTWNHGNYPANLRPESITINLLAGGVEVQEAVVTAADNWSWSFGNLPVYDEQGVEITYTITEDPVANYTPQVDGYNVTNTYVPVTTEVSGSKTWNHGNSPEELRPESITINLLADGDEVDSKVVTEADNWSWSFTGLDKYDAEGNEIKYTITEDPVDSYTPQVDGYNVTNTYVPVTIDVEGVKTWGDNDDADGRRPKSIKINLLANGTPIDQFETKASKKWAYKFNDLPKYDDNGNVIAYSVEEVIPNANWDYAPEYIKGTYDINNVYNPEKISIEGSKTWNDNDNQDGKRPSSIDIYLIADDTVIVEKTVTAATDWEYSFENLFKYNTDGTEIQYKVAEGTVANYVTSYKGYDIINSYEPEKTTITVIKVWDDMDDQDGIRPDSVTVELIYKLNDDTGWQLGTYQVGDDTTWRVLSDKNGWRATFTVDVYSMGEDVTYFVRETEVPDDYSASIKWDEAMQTFFVTNKHTPEKINISGHKFWDDNYDQDGKRPESVTIVLLKNGEPFQSKVVTAADNWDYRFSNLYAYENGKEIEYTIGEVSVPEYETSVNGYDVTNTYTPGKTIVSGHKIWEDKNDQDGIRPESITINLLADGEVIDSQVVTAEEGWSWKFEGLDVYADGTKIVYTITEEAVEGYETIIMGYNVKNVYNPEKISVSGTKTWNDQNDKDGKRPESITINLLANGKKVDSVVVTAEDDWSYSFENLDKFANGKQIKYKITENAVEGYTVSYDGYDVTNTYTPEKKPDPKPEPENGNDTDPDPKPPVVIPDGEIPRGGVDDDPDPSEILGEEEVPLGGAEAPETGDASLLWAAAAAVSGLGMFFVNTPKKRKDEE